MQICWRCWLSAGCMPTATPNSDRMIVPTLRVGMPIVTLRVTPLGADAERPGLHSHAERGNDRVTGLAD
ncbi:hypothetical protein PspR76_29170 [Pseudomonas sp. R76]|nr:hypothetical protein PspR76_29170 [Pseudomonas sp. R76]